GAGGLPRRSRILAGRPRAVASVHREGLSMCEIAAAALGATRLHQILKSPEAAEVAERLSVLPELEWPAPEMRMRRTPRLDRPIQVACLGDLDRAPLGGRVGPRPSMKTARRRRSLAGQATRGVV